MTDVMVQTPPFLHAPSEKERKYDRQLRLWAASGQAALESANILLLNSGSATVGVETLKNLVLPGIGKFTIADESIVEPADLGVNFFLDQKCCGERRAKGCTKFLCELNPEVDGNWWPRSEEENEAGLIGLLNTAEPFTIILYTYPIEKDRLDEIKKYSKQHCIPLVAVHSAGFYSYFNINLPGAFPIVETHPDESATTDLRLLAPWPELLEFTERMTADLDSQSSHEHGHIPLVVILLHHLEKWKQAHGGLYPVTYADKQAFRATIFESMRKDNPEGGEENFEEAMAAVMQHVVQPGIPSSLKKVFDYKQQPPDEQSSSFWVISAAVKQFYDRHKVLPVPGSLPDMKAQSKIYIDLQNLYKDKARKDANEVLHIASSLPGGGAIDKEEVHLFCKNARFIKLVNEVTDHALTIEQVIERELVAGERAATSLIPGYLALMATAHNREATAEEIIAAISESLPTASNNKYVIKAAEEVARAAGGELHNVSAAVGGMVAQEMIKAITKQYVPIDNTCIFDGIVSRCQVLRLRDAETGH